MLPSIHSKSRRRRVVLNHYSVQRLTTDSAAPQKLGHATAVSSPVHQLDKQNLASQHSPSPTCPSLFAPEDRDSFRYGQVTGLSPAFQVRIKSSPNKPRPIELNGISPGNYFEVVTYGRSPAPACASRRYPSAKLLLKAWRIYTAVLSERSADRTFGNDLDAHELLGHSGSRRLLAVPPQPIDGLRAKKRIEHRTFRRRSVDGASSGSPLRTDGRRATWDTRRGRECEY